MDAALQRAVFPPTFQTRVNRFLATLSVQWSGAERLVNALYRGGIRYVYTPVGLVLAAAVCVAGSLAFLDVVRTGSGYHLANRHLGVAFAVLFALDMVIVFIHELGHATALVHFGRRVKAAGFRIYFGTPAFFIESSDALMLSRGRRIVQAAAGPGLELVGTSIAAILVWALPPSSAGADAVPVRAHQLLRAVPQPHPAAGAGRLLDPLGLAADAQPAAGLAGLRAARGLGQARQARAVHQGRGRARRCTARWVWRSPSSRW